MPWLRAFFDLQVGFSKDGKIQALDIDLYANAGNTVDLSFAVSVDSCCRRLKVL